MTLFEILLALSLGALLVSGGFQVLADLTAFNQKQEAQWHQVRQGIQIAYSLRNLLSTAHSHEIQISKNPTQLTVIHSDLAKTVIYWSPSKPSQKTSVIYWVHPNGYRSLWVADVRQFEITGPLTQLTLQLTLEHPRYAAHYWLTS